MRYYYVVFVLGLVASVSAFSVLPQPQNTRVYRLHGLTESAIEYIQKLPPTLSTKEERARLISWYCRLRDLNHARNTIPMKTLTERTGLKAETIKKLDYIYGRLEEKLLNVNLRLVLKVALSYLDKGLDFNDLMHEGIRGLKRAAEKFDSSKGVCFSTYAYPWIQVYIKAALASSLPITLPRHVYQLLTKVYAVKNRLYLTTGRQATEEELATELGISMERFQVVKKAIALAERGNMDKNDDVPVPYHESTWEATVSDEMCSDVTVENVISHTTQPTWSTTNTVINQKLYGVLKSLPQEENEAIFNHLTKSRVGRDVSDQDGEDHFLNNSSLIRHDRIAENDVGETQKIYYRKGMRRLRRNIKSGKVDLQDVPVLTQTSAYM